MNQAIANIIKSHIEGLDFVDKIAGMTRVLTFDMRSVDKDNNPITVQKSFPVACCVSAEDCKEGAYNELMPNSDYKTVIYFEDNGVAFVKSESNWKYYTSNVRLVCWINVAKILGDACNEGTACTLAAHLIVEIIRALPEFPQHHNPFNFVFSEVVNQDVTNPSIFSQYTYDEKHTQYLMYPYDYFALDIKTDFAVCMKGTGVYDSDCGHRTDTIAAPVATAASDIDHDKFTAHWNAVAGASGYAIDVATDVGFVNTVLKDERIGNVLSILITNLESGITYYYRIRAYNDYTESASSNVISALTLGVADNDGNHYTTVILGSQEWMVENLKTTKYNDGTPIVNVTDQTAWSLLITGAYCWYDNLIVNKTDYGALYNWYAVNTGKLAPTGWRVPSAADFATLITFAGGAAIAGGKLKEIGLTHWAAPNADAVDTYGFKGLGAGQRDLAVFTLMKNDGQFWRTANDGSFSRIKYTDGIYTLSMADYKIGLSVRCMRDI